MINSTFGKAHVRVQKMPEDVAKKLRTDKYTKICLVIPGDIGWLNESVHILKIINADGILTIGSNEARQFPELKDRDAEQIFLEL